MLVGKSCTEALGFDEEEAGIDSTVRELVRALCDGGGVEGRVLECGDEITEGGELRHGAETKEAVGLRGLAAINDWAYQAGKDTDLFIFSHGAWINQTLQTVLGMTTIYPDFASLVSMRNAFWVKLSSLDLPDGSVRWRLEEYEHGPVAAYITDWNNPDLASV